MKIDGLLFDKDGTLFDFHATWSVWAASMISELAGEDPVLIRRLAHETGFDLDQGRFRPESAIIAGTNREAAECVARALPHHNVDEIETFLMQSSSKAPLEPAVPLVPLLDQLRGLELKLGVMTNDTEFGARSHLGAAGVLDKFDFVAGFDSGYGAKPSPEPLLAFAKAVALPPGAVIMIGDSTHDLVAGRAAGMTTIGVLTGTACRADLTPYADAVLPDIGHLPSWIVRSRAGGDLPSD